jgi:hypothetical protein
VEGARIGCFDTLSLVGRLTRRGWKDLAPLLDKAMEWECERAMHDHKVFTRLSDLRQETNDLVQRLENSEEFYKPPSFISNNTAIRGAVGAHSNGGPVVDIPMIVTSDNEEDTESSDSYPQQFFPDDEVGSIESPPRSRSSSSNAHGGRSLVEESSTSFFDQEITSNRINLSSPRNNHVKQASFSRITVETIE